MAKVSIIVPIYKVEKYIHQCIDSLVNQTLKDIEIILVDDGSPDNCGQICDEYASKDNRIKVIHKKNGGVSAARNDGIKASTSDYIMLVDSDDWCDEKMCEIAYNTIIKENADISIFTHFNNLPDFEKKNFKLNDFIKLDNSNQIEYLQMSALNTNYIKLLNKEFNYDGFATPWGKIYRSDLIKDNNITFNLNVHGIFDDGLFVLETLQYSKIVTITAIPVYHYRIIETSILNKFNPDRLKIFFNVFEEIEKFIKKYNKNEYFSKAYYYRVILYLITSLKTYFFYPLNKAKFSDKAHEFKELMNNPVYKNAIYNVDKKFLTKSHKIYLFLFKTKNLYIIKLYYSIIKFIKKIIGKK